MPVLPEFIEVAESMNGRTVSLSGDSSAVLFSALAALSQLWQWTKEGGLDSADVDYIDALLAKANSELMQPMIGDIVSYVTTDAPPYTIPCDGGSYLREDYPQLYAVIDTSLILDADTFKTPDMRRSFPVGTGAVGLSASYAVGEQGGEESISLTAEQNGSHQHALNTTNGIALAPGELPVKVPTLVGVDGTGFSGSGEAHENRPPFTALNFAVRYL